MSKKLFKALCGALAATMLLTACAGGGSSSGGASSGAASTGASSAAASSGEKYTVGFVSATFSDEYCKRLADAFVGCSNDEVEVKALNGNGDVAQIISCIETFHSQKVDALIVQGIGNVPDACTWCNEEGVPLVFVNIKPQLSDTTKNLDYVYVGSSEEAIGAQLAEAMASGLPEGEKESYKVCALELALGQDNQIYRDKGFCEWLAENRPDIEIIDKQSYKTEATAEAMSITEDWIQRFGVDGIDAIATQGSTITIGVIEALKSHDATDKLKVAGISIPPTMDWILDGTAYSDLYQDPMAEASKSVDAALKMIKGEEVTFDYPEENWINVDMTTVTAENVQEVMASATY